MKKTLVPVGFGNYVVADNIVAVAAFCSAPVKHNIEDARDSKKLIDLTAGRKTKVVIYTYTGHLVLAAIESVTLQSRTTAALENNNE